MKILESIALFSSGLLLEILLGKVELMSSPQQTANFWNKKGKGWNRGISKYCMYVKADKVHKTSLRKGTVEFIIPNCSFYVCFIKLSSPIMNCTVQTTFKKGEVQDNITNGERGGQDLESMIIQWNWFMTVHMDFFSKLTNGTCCHKVKNIPKNI